MLIRVLIIGIAIVVDILLGGFVCAGFAFGISKNRNTIPREAMYCLSLLKDSSGKRGPAPECAKDRHPPNIAFLYCFCVNGFLNINSATPYFFLSIYSFSIIVGKKKALNSGIATRCF